MKYQCENCDTEFETIDDTDMCPYCGSTEIKEERHD